MTDKQNKQLNLEKYVPTVNSDLLNLEAIDNSQITVGQELPLILTKYYPALNATLTTAKVINKTNTRLYIERTTGQKITFDYYKTKRLTSKDKVSLTAYELYDTVQAYNTQQLKAQEYLDTLEEIKERIPTLKLDELSKLNTYIKQY